MPQPLVLAHRGLSAEKAENTLAAFHAAAAAGFDGFEMDLQLTADGEVVVVHDESLERTTDWPALVAEVTVADLAQHPTPDGPVPMLHELYAALTAYKGLWNLELKGEGVAGPALQLAAASPFAARTLVTCMDAQPLREAQRTHPSIPRGLITIGWPDEADLEEAQAAGCTWLMADEAFLDQGAAQHIRRKGLRLGVWTVNDPERARECVTWGAELVMTDTREVLAALHRTADGP